MKEATVREEALVFGCHGEQLVGILHRPSVQAETAVIVIVGGPQYRAGSHRQFVQVARALADAGHPVLRFDYRGMGDSSGVLRNFEQVSDDVGAAIDLLQQRLPSVRHIVLWGLCDGASAALLYCDQTHDLRVVGLCALNPWVRSESSLAATQLKHYYTRRLLQREFWTKLLRGQVASGALSDLLRKLKIATTAKGGEDTTFRHRMARAWRRLNGHVLLILSDDDYTAKEFAEHAQTNSAWRGTLDAAYCRTHHVAKTDHTFSSSTSQQTLERLVLQWLDELCHERSSDHMKAA